MIRFELKTIAKEGKSRRSVEFAYEEVNPEKLGEKVCQNCRKCDEKNGEANAWRHRDKMIKSLILAFKTSPVRLSVDDHMANMLGRC